MNRIILTGYLANDPETLTTQSGISRCGFRLAVQRKYKNPQGERETDFFSCVAWRGTADFISRYFAKGSKIAIEGSLQTRSYSAQDGSKRYITEVIIDGAEFCERTNQDNPADNAPADNAPAGSNGFAEIDDDELPF